MSQAMRMDTSRAGRYLVRNELRFLLGLWVVFVIGVAVVAAVVASLTAGTINSSVWEKAVQAPRWFVGVWGIYQSAVYLPLFIANGCTRREFGVQIIRLGTVYAVVLAALITVGFALEWAVFGLLGWQQALDEPHLLFSVATEYPQILAQYALTFFAWIAVGAAVGAAFYRHRHWALLIVPLALGTLVFIENLLASNWLFDAATTRSNRPRFHIDPSRFSKARLTIEWWSIHRRTPATVSPPSEFAIIVAARCHL